MCFGVSSGNSFRDKFSLLEDNFPLENITANLAFGIDREIYIVHFKIGRMWMDFLSKSVHLYRGFRILRSSLSGYALAY